MLTTTGFSQLAHRLLAVADKVPNAAGAALYAEAEIEMKEAKRRTPVATGALRASGYVDQPNISRGDINVILGFGGAARAYAIEVHENLEAWHRVGQAKYLESVLWESEPHMLKRVARRLNIEDLT